MIIYQMMVRLFGNKDTVNKFNGSVEENGTGKFNDVNDKALDGLKKLGISHVWYTGCIEHATMTDYSSFGIKQDDPDIVKGRAGSPYAIKDYYDVDPDLAIDVNKRMAEFESLVKRTHAHKLKVIIDFVPNHVARTYHSDVKPESVRNFGEDDDVSQAFSPANDFYYIPGKRFRVPKGVDAGGREFNNPMKDGRFDEYPAKATGNNVFKENPSIDDWCETVKLNYGVDYQYNKSHFETMPPVWLKMKDILVFWAKKKVDGFRCDMAEMVPVEFWNWVIPEVKKINPKIIFIAEAYDQTQYIKYLTLGKFDYLYDKVGLYDSIKKLIRNEPGASTDSITHITQQQRNFASHMLRFLENHDEERIASNGFAGNPWYAIPAMVLTTTLSSGPAMIYFGQEVGEPGAGREGFGGDDNRTTIFDYWGVPEHQKWMNKGEFDGALLSDDQKKLRDFYSTLLNYSANSEAIRSGQLVELAGIDAFAKNNYAFIRYTPARRILVAVNFDREKSFTTSIKLPASLSSQEKITVKEILSGKTSKVDLSGGFPVDVPAMGAVIFEF
ncbi:alpha-amylase family protein [Hufsiella arboris]|nr:alpha-amylase family protein [Hufsiella arboris]